MKTIVNNVLCRMDESCIKSPKDGENGLKKMFPKVFVHHLENRKT